MPTYRTRQTTKKKGPRRYPKRLPRDPDKLFRWAAKGSPVDYERLRALAKKARHSLPAHIDGVAFEKLMHVDRLTMIEQIQAAEEHDISAGWFLDAVNWLFDKIPLGNWIWPVSAAQSAINTQKGDGLNEVDEQYARLVGATYGAIDERPYVIDHWKRQVQFDSSYISVFDNPDGHRVICVRGTQGTGTDIGEDILVGLTGRSTNLIGGELLDILAATPEGTVVDLAAHSLGTSLLTQAFEADDTLQDRIRQSYLYAPAFTPFAENVTGKYQKDDRVRYFIDLEDWVSLGNMGSSGPVNVVYRDGWTLNPLAAHAISGWEGNLDLKEENKPDIFSDNAPDRSGLPTKGLAAALGEGVLLDFGANWDASALGFG